MDYTALQMEGFFMAWIRIDLPADLKEWLQGYCAERHLSMQQVISYLVRALKSDLASADSLRLKNIMDSLQTKQSHPE